MIKALHICQRDDPNGGVPHIAFEFVKRLPAKNVDAHCLFLYGKRGYFGNQLGNRAHYLGIPDSSFFFQFRRLYSFLKKFKPHIIHHHDGLFWPNLFTLHHPHQIKITHSHIDLRQKPTFGKSYLVILTQRLSSDAFVCISHNNRANCINNKAFDPNRTFVIVNGVDMDRFRLRSEHDYVLAKRHFKLDDNKFVVGFVGRLECSMKGTDDFLKVISLLPHTYHAIIVGTGPDENRLKFLSKELNIDSRVTFTGALENSQVAYHAMDCFCVTSHWESFGLVAAEAMACGIPVIGFACPGGISEILTPDTGFIIENRNFEEMANAIQAIRMKPNGAMDKVNQAREFIKENNNWDEKTQALADLYTIYCHQA